MYSDIFFGYMRENWRHFRTHHSDKEIEHAIYSELKSPDYKNLRQALLAENSSLPPFVISNCSVLDRNLSYVTKNIAIEYQPDAK